MCREHKILEEITTLPNILAITFHHISIQEKDNFFQDLKSLNQGLSADK